MKFGTATSAVGIVVGMLGFALQAQAATTYTGDKIEGVPVITRLDVGDLPAGKAQRFMFRGVEMGTGQHWYVPVIVAKGPRPGKRILLVAGVHGDELNPIAAVQQVFAELDASRLSGAVIGLLGPSRPGVEYVTRTWPMSDLGPNLINPNRTWPGNEHGNTVQRHSWLIMNQLIKGNVDIGIDFHTGGTGIDFARFVFAYAEDAESQRLAALFPVDQIMKDPGLEGTLEYAMVRAGIPALTVELGGPRGFHPDMVKLGVDGTANVLAHYGVTDKAVGATAKDVNVYIGNDLEDIVATTGGFVELLVKLNDAVTKGQKIAVQRNGFGDVVQEYSSGVDGRVAIIGTDAVRERGVTIATILWNNPGCTKDSCTYLGEEP